MPAVQVEMEVWVVERGVLVVSLVAVAEVDVVSVAVEVDVLRMVTVEVWLRVVVRVSVVVTAVETLPLVVLLAPPDREAVSLAEIVVIVTVTVSGPEQAKSVALGNACQCAWSGD